MAFKQVLAGASLALLALSACPAAFAANDGNGNAPPAASSPTQQAPTARPHRTLTPEQRAARKAKRQARRLARQQQMQSPAPN
jgi:Spy/CpxP family protein refolding chaperone